MEYVPHWLTQALLSMRSVTTICAFIGIFYIIHDMRNLRRGDEDDSLDDEVKRIREDYIRRRPTFVLICFAVLLSVPTAFSNILNVPLLPIMLQKLGTLASLICSMVYFYLLMVLRLKAYNLSGRDAFLRGLSIFTGMVLLSLVGFYGL